MKTLDAEEMRWLAKFVRSPFHNNHKDVIRLFDIIRKYYPELDSPKLAKEDVFKKLWPKKSYADRQLRLLMFRLSGLVEEFMVVQQLKRRTVAYDKLLVEALGERDLYEYFVKHTNELYAKTEAETYRDETYHGQLWQLQQDFLSHPQTNKFEITAAFYQEAMKNLDLYYATTKLRFGSEMINRESILGENHEIFLLEEIAFLIQNKPAYQYSEALKIYYDALSLMRDKADEVVFKRLEERFLQNRLLFRKADQVYILKFLINATIYLNTNVNNKYWKNQFELYKLGLDHDLLTIAGKLPASTFLNVVVTTTVLHELLWAKAFIDQYREGQTSDTILLAEAFLYAAQKEFDISNEKLAQIEARGLPYQLRVKLLFIRNYYEILLQNSSYYRLFVSETNAFEKFIRRNDQITENRAKSYLNFIAFIRKLGRLKYENKRFDDTQNAKLIEDLTAIKPIEARRWLLEKLQS